MSVVVLDSFALIAYLRRGVGHATVSAALRKAADARLTVAMTEVNYAEVKYTILRKEGSALWRQVENLLSVLPITFYPIDRLLADQAADMKARFKMSLADACAAALAKRLGAALYTNDPQFDALKDDIRIYKLAD